MKIKKQIKIIMIAATSLAILAAGLITARIIIKNHQQSNTTYKVTSETYENVIEVSGVVSAAQEQTLQALSDGTVLEVYVKQGDSVKEGDVIIQLDDTDEQYNLAKQDYDMATVRISGSARQYQLMQTQRLALVQKIAERKVTATFDGIIASIDVAVGDSLEAKDSVGTLVDVSYLTAEVEIAETDVSKLKIGQKVELTFPAYDGTVEGYITGWPAIGEVTSRGATIVNAKIRIDDYPETILPNFSFSGKIEIAPAETFTIVSRYAVGRENGQAYVVKAGSSEKISVSVMPYDKEYVKIVEGNIKEGDVLQAQSSASKSGTSRRNGPGQMSSGKNNSGGGAGRPPPGGF